MHCSRVTHLSFRHTLVFCSACLMTLEIVFFENCHFILADCAGSGPIKRQDASQTTSDAKASQFAQIMFLKTTILFQSERKHYDKCVGSKTWLAGWIEQTFDGLNLSLKTVQYLTRNALFCTIPLNFHHHKGAFEKNLFCKKSFFIRSALTSNSTLRYS